MPVIKLIMDGEGAFRDLQGREIKKGDRRKLKSADSGISLPCRLVIPIGGEK